MNQTTLTKLQYDEIIQKIKEKAIGQHSQAIIEEWLPQNNLATVNKRQAETKEARLILDSQQHVPFMGLSRITLLTEQVKKGLILPPGDLIECGDFYEVVVSFASFLKKINIKRLCCITIVVIYLNCLKWKKRLIAKLAIRKYVIQQLRN